MNRLSPYCGTSPEGSAVLKQASNSYRRRKFIEEANAAFAALRNNPEAWTGEQQERDLWDRTSGDGLKRE